MQSLRTPAIDDKTILNCLNRINPAQNDAYDRLDDITSAKIFEEVFRDTFLFNTTAGMWYYYDGVRWTPDEKNAMVEKYSMILARALWCYATRFLSREDFKNYVGKLQDRDERQTMIRDAQCRLTVSQSQFDADPNLFNCLNGVLNLKEHTFIDHDPKLLLSKVANANYHPEKVSDDFLKFLDEVMQGDTEKIKFLQTIFGLSMCGTGKREEAYMLYGATTRNGKSTLTNTIRHLVGSYGGNLQPESLALQKNKDGRSASGDIARLQGLRFIQMSEPPKRMKFDVQLFKNLTGQDKITARFLYQSEFEFVSTGTLFINTNHLPIISDDTMFSSDRMKVITFDRHFSDAEQDRGLKDRLMSDDNLSGILNWMFEGLIRYHSDDNTVNIPDSVKQATEDYKLKQDKIKSFIDECLSESPFTGVTAKDAYKAYDEWCHLNGYGVENKRNFIDELRNKGLLSDTGTVNGKTYRNVIRGYELTDDIRIMDDNTDD